MKALKGLLRGLLCLLYRVKTSGFEHYVPDSRNCLFIANHVSWLDGILLYAWLPGTPAFVINQAVLDRLPRRFLSALVCFFELDMQSAHSLRRLVEYLRQGHCAVIFPEGRITTTGGLMKIYEGTGLVADHAHTQIFPIHIDGPQRSVFSYLRGRGPIHWFPAIRMQMLPPQRLALPETVSGRARRLRATHAIEKSMQRAQYQCTRQQTLLFDAIWQAARRHGMRRTILEPPQGHALTYRAFMIRSAVLAEVLRAGQFQEPWVGLMLPNVPATPVAFLALQALGKVPAMINFSSGSEDVRHCCALAGLKTVLSSRRFVEEAGLQSLVQVLEDSLRVVYLEDLAAAITLRQKYIGLVRGMWPALGRGHRHKQRASDPAVVLFTSGSESRPKGVVLSHSNLLSNYAQAMCCLDFGHQDRVFSCLPLFHSFGLSAGLLIPLLAGARVFLYPSPLHYRRIPDQIYQCDATVLFGTNTFFRAYARGAHPYDFYSLRYAIAGAEKLQDDTLRLWMEKFGIRIYQGYGVTEMSPVVSVNTPQAGKISTTGRLLPAIRARLVPVEGIPVGGRLQLFGDNVMLGYLSGIPDKPGIAPEYALPDVPGVVAEEPGWYDTGDIASIDEDGFVSLLGRVRRFAKLGGEMVSLAVVEEIASRAWPDHAHAAVSMSSRSRGERIVLVSTCPEAAQGLRDFREVTQHAGLSMLHIPQRIYTTESLPVLGTGKLDYPGVQTLVEELEKA